tara:strand:+ start:1913 stop:2362 length:450 start_codon:yes stop_codon:yes gene_type:complete
MSITLIGNLVRDAELKQKRNGDSFLTFKMAVNTGWGESEETIFYEVAVWNSRLSESLQDIAKGGYMATVIGDLQGVWAKERPDGSVTSSLKVSASRVVIHRTPKKFLGESQGQMFSERKTSYSQGGQAEWGKKAGFTPEPDDDNDPIPF